MSLSGIIYNSHSFTRLEIYHDILFHSIIIVCSQGLEARLGDLILANYKSINSYPGSCKNLSTRIKVTRVRFRYNVFPP